MRLSDQVNWSVQANLINAFQGNKVLATATQPDGSIARGMIRAAQDGATFFNQSLGGNSPSPLLGEINRQIAAQGGVIFAAAGNRPGTQLVFPAADPWVNAVTALDASGQIAPYANTGGFVDLAAPGTAYVQFRDQTYSVAGTSSASAWTGLARRSSRRSAASTSASSSSRSTSSPRFPSWRT
jgi:hypothetical protein